MLTRKRIPLAALLPLLLVVLLAACSSTSAAAWPGCKAYSDQPSAQAAWEAAGKPAGADGDGDGKVCESLPAAPAPTARAPGRPAAPATRCRQRPLPPRPGALAAASARCRTRAGCTPGSRPYPPRSARERDG